MTQAPVVILNTTAGTGCDAAVCERIVQAFERAGAVPALQRVSDARAILAAARAARDAGAPRIVAAGGDGTVSAVASVVAGSPAVLGVLPLGTLNHFAKDAGIPLGLDEAVATAVHGTVRQVDVGEVNGRVFINNSSLGLYPDLVRDRQRRQRRLGQGKWRALLAAGVVTFRRYPLLTLEIDIDGARHLLQVPFVFIGNNAYAMEGFEIGERARLDDGYLALYLTQHTGRFALLRLALRALFRRLEPARDFASARARMFVVRADHALLRVATDGEVNLMDTPLHYRIRPGALRVVVPADQR